MKSKADLHVHSKYSCRPSEWILRRIGAPESFVEPEEVYRRAKANGMDFVTISDHNCIDGALEIDQYPDTFLSAELTTYFPENRCKIHCLVSGVTEPQFEQLQEARENIYDLRQCLQDNGIVHTIAHPLFAINDRLNTELVEKLLVMFNRFEAVNGTRYPRANELFTVIAENLTPDLIARMADKHGIEPAGQHPWRKSFTGGSDDHSGLYVASAYTTTEQAETPQEFIANLASGLHRNAGISGSSLKLAHSFYLIAYSYYKTRFMDHDASGKPNLLGALMQKLIESPPQKKPAEGTVKRLAARIVRPWKTRKLNPVERSLVSEFTRLFDDESLESVASGKQPLDRRSFQMACEVSQELGCGFLKQFVDRVQAGSLMESLQTLASLGPVACSIAPYLAAFRTQHKDESFLQELATRFDSARHLTLRSQRKAWFADTFDADSEQGTTTRRIVDDARRQGQEITVFTCLPNSALHTVNSFNHHNFTPVDTFELPECPNVHLAFPPFLEIIEHIERLRVSEIIISTPGPLGLTALLAGNLLGLRTVGLYQADYREMVRRQTEDDDIAQLAWKYICWFYGQLDTLRVSNASFAKQFVQSGFDPDTVSVLTDFAPDALPTADAQPQPPTLHRKCA
ncbi:MAG: hypothetical protein ACOCWJ_03475 [Verrucomicrobiota bacterium]